MKYICFIKATARYFHFVLLLAFCVFLSSRVLLENLFFLLQH